MDEVILPHGFIDRIIAHGRSAYPDEACGILAGEGNEVSVMYEATNVKSSPVSYLIEPQEQFMIMKEIRNIGMRMVAIYHSHPVSLPYPSRTDVEQAFYSDAAYIIAGFSDRERPELRAFEIVDGKVREISIVIKRE
jgi:proteasome lid subunit RPN8/RPN11